MRAWTVQGIFWLGWFFSAASGWMLHGDFEALLAQVGLMAAVVALVFLAWHGRWISAGFWRVLGVCVWCVEEGAWRRVRRRAIDRRFRSRF